jgi:putative drug exporter of the RND superfamily
MPPTTFAARAARGMIDFKMMGVGLAVAVLIDATIVRAVPLPATMKLLGDWNWCLPRRLEWLPRLGRHDPPTATPTPTPIQEPRIPARV